MTLERDELIDSLNISPRKKELFHLINKHNLLRRSLIILNKQQKKIISNNDRFALNTNLWAFLFSFFYYFALGLWRKGLVLLLLSLAILALLYFVDFKSYLLAFLPSALAAVMVLGDEYRDKVLKQKFWF